MGQMRKNKGKMKEHFYIIYESQPDYRIQFNSVLTMIQGINVEADIFSDHKEQWIKVKASDNTIVLSFVSNKQSGLNKNQIIDYLSASDVVKKYVQ